MSEKPNYWFAVPIKNSQIEEYASHLQLEDPILPEHRHITILYCGKQRVKEDLLRAGDILAQAMWSDYMTRALSAEKWPTPNGIAVVMEFHHAVLLFAFHHILKNILEVQTDYDVYRPHMTWGYNPKETFNENTPDIDRLVTIDIDRFGLYASGEKLIKEWPLKDLAR